MAYLAKNSNICNQFLELEVSFGGKRCLVGSFSPVLFGNSIDIIFICILRYLLVFYTIPTLSLSFSCPSLHSILYLNIPFSSLWIFLLQSPQMFLHNYILFPVPREMLYSLSLWLYIFLCLQNAFGRLKI